MAGLEEEPLRERHGEDMRDNEEAYSAGWCCGFSLWGTGWRQSHEGGRKYLLQQNEGHREAWLATQLHNIKQFTEVVAGPKWKTFIRKVGAYCNIKNRKKQRHAFQYDPQSYALNFDDGVDEEDDGLVGVGFSSRFVAPFPDEKRGTRS